MGTVQRSDECGAGYQRRCMWIEYFLCDAELGGGVLQRVDTYEVSVHCPLGVSQLPWPKSIKVMAQR